MDHVAVARICRVWWHRSSCPRKAEHQLPGRLERCWSVGTQDAGPVKCMLLVPTGSGYSGVLFSVSADDFAFQDPTVPDAHFGLRRDGKEQVSGLGKAHQANV
jgi:hypothetical protein